MRYAVLPAVLALGCVVPSAFAQDTPFEEAVINVGDVGITVTNAGFIGEASARNNPTGPPSFEYPLDSGIEHLFEAGLWIGAIRRETGSVTVRSGAVTSSQGYQPGRSSSGYEMAQTSLIQERSTLPGRAYSPRAVSHQDFIASFADTAVFLPGTNIPMPDPAARLGADVSMTTYAWSFPFTESFAIVEFDIVNLGPSAWDSVYVGLYHDLVVRNINTTTETGSDFFNKGGYGFIDSLQASYAFNAGGQEETRNTYGSIVFLGAEWENPQSGETWFFHPEVAERYTDAGFTAPYVNPRWWKFAGGTDELSQPSSDLEQYDRMARPYPNPGLFASEAAYEDAVEDWRDRLRSDGVIADGNWIGLTPVGPFPSVLPGDTLTVTFALVAAFKPDAFQGQDGKALDTEESRALLRNNIGWARRTYAGEDNNFNGQLDTGEDVNGNGRLDRYLIPEPPRSPKVRVELEEGRALVYWDRSAEASRDPVTGRFDFEGYRVYRTQLGDDVEQAGDLFGRASLIAQRDSTGNRVGYNNGFEDITLPEPVTFEGDTTQYHYRFEVDQLLSGWQYAFAVTAFDEGDVEAGLQSFESSRVAAARRVFPGTPAADGSRTVGVYPNPYRVNAAWDGESSRSRRLNFYNLPARAEVRIYTLAGEIVDEFVHEEGVSQGDIRWFDEFSAEDRQMAGGEHAWDLLSRNGLNLATGLYLFTVRDLDSGDTQTGKFVIIK